MAPLILLASAANVGLVFLVATRGAREWWSIGRPGEPLDVAVALAGTVAVALWLLANGVITWVVWGALLDSRSVIRRTLREPLVRRVDEGDE